MATPPTPPPEGSPAAKAGVQTLVDGMKTLYESKETSAQDAVVSNLYSERAVFIDNVVHVHTQKGIQLQFHAVAKLFKSCTVSGATVTVEDAGKVVIISATQTYALGKREVPLEATTTLTLDAEGKIEKHVDVWKDTYSSWGFVKRAMGSTTSGIFRLFRL